MKKYSLHAVSLIEVMVAIMIFFLGLVSVYSVVSSTLKLNQYNENFIVASHLAQEQIEIIKNIRDYNFREIRKWDSINSDADTSWEIGSYYKVSNAYGGNNFLDVDISKIENFKQGVENLQNEMQEYRLCIDENNTYSYNCIGNTKTPFYRYMFVDEVFYMDENDEKITIPDAMKFTSRVIWYQGGYRETDISIILTDWQRL